MWKWKRRCSLLTGSLSLLFPLACQDRECYIIANTLVHGVPHSIRRSDVFADVISMYQDNISELLQEYPFRVQFEGEKAIDVGGVARDMYSAFYEEAYKKYFDGNVLLSPIVHPEMNTSVLSTLGAIVSHGYLVTGVLPVRIAFPCLAQCLLGQATIISPSILIETLLDSLSPFEATIMNGAINEAKQNLSSFSSDVMSVLVSVLSRFDIRHLPTPPKFKQVLTQIASYEFLAKPSVALAAMNSGVPKQHKPFWDGVIVDDLLSIYYALTASPATVLGMFEDAVGMNSNEERVLGYLRQFVGSMSSDSLRNFLRFVTGSSVCSSQKLEVSFNSLSGAARRPIAHTCTPSLELSWTYRTYPEFVDEFSACLSNQYAWAMDAV